MWARARPAEYARGNESNRAAFTALAGTGEPMGLLAYRGDTVVGWASVSPREQLLRIVGDPETAAAEAAHEPGPVWAVPCFYIRAGHRRQGVATALLEAAIRAAREVGAASLEAYPIEGEGRVSNGSAWTGLRSMFTRAGFEEVGRFDRWRAIPGLTGPDPVQPHRPPGRPVMRLALGS
jgi:GNAT superfamily N-acetyltransferase